MVYAGTTGFIIYWNTDQHFVIHRHHHVWFDKYNCHISIEDKHTPGSLLIRQYHEIQIHNSDLLNLIPCEIGFTPTPFCGTTIFPYEIELPPYGNKFGFNLLYN